MADPFVEAVRDMRRLQKLYFGGRSVQVLEQAKAAEKKVDDMLSGHVQGDLFGGNHGR